MKAMELSSYIAYLLSEPGKISCVRASEILSVSHDGVNRLLLSGQWCGKDLFDAVKGGLVLVGGVLSIDDSVLDKRFSNPETTELAAFFWLGRHHKTVKGINLIVLFYTDRGGKGFPVNFRVYRHKEEKSKHNYFQEMVKQWTQKATPDTTACMYLINKTAKT